MLNDMSAPRMRVCIIYHYFAHYREPVILRLKELVGESGEIVLISGTETNIPALKLMSLEQSADFRWIRVKNVWLPGGWLWQSGLLESLVKADCDQYIFLGQFNFISTWLAAAVMRLLRKRVLFWTHGLYGNEGVIKHFARTLFYRLANSLLVYGNRARRLLLQDCFHRDSVYVIYNSICSESHDWMAASNIERSAGVPAFSWSPTAIFVGRLTPEKELRLVVDALALLRKQRKHVNLLIVGDGPERHALETYSNDRLGPGNVYFAGACYSTDLLRMYFEQATTCVSPGNVGLTAIHAMAHGVPVISHGEMSLQMPEAEAIVSNMTGLFFKRGDVVSLAEAINAIIERPLPELAKMRDCCRRMVAMYYNAQHQVEVMGAALHRQPASTIEFEYRLC